MKKLQVLLLVAVAALALAPGSAGAATTERVSVDSAGAQAAGGSSFDPAVSADGRFVAFHSSATNLVAGDTNALADIFVRDRTLGTTERVSVDSAGAQAAGGHSDDPAISADGRFVAFQSWATNLVAGDTNALSDIFVRSFDDDGDLVHEHDDNCPDWPNAAQNLPAWPVPALDSDCDGFTKVREQHVGTDPAKQCNLTATANDEAVDAWPTDFNDSRLTSLADVVLMGPAYNKFDGQAGYNQRFDLNASNGVTLADVVLMGPFYNKGCA